MDAVAAPTREADELLARIAQMSNDALIIDLMQTVNHLSRWLTPIHDRSLLEFSPRRSQPSVKDLLLRMRDTETRVYALMYAIGSATDPDLDLVPRVERSPQQIAFDREADPLVVMSEFRRVRQSSGALLRSLPDTAWERGGYSRSERNWTIRELAEFLAAHDVELLREIDNALIQSEAREGIAEVSQVTFDLIGQPFVSSSGRG
jgi:hypothetical protein